MSQIELQFPLSEVKHVVNHWLYLEEDTIIDIALAVYVANLLATDPLWLILIGPPSNTKTEILRAFDGHENAVFISNLTPSTLVSGSKKKQGAPDPSLLPKLNDKLVLIKDFTTILSMRHENREEIISQLREAYDGQYSKMFGTGKQFNWKGKFGLLAASTPYYDSCYGVIGAMGDRFLLYRTESGNGFQMAQQARLIVGQETQTRLEIRNAFHSFINQFESFNPVEFEENEDIIEKMIFLANIVAYCRCPIKRDYHKNVEYLPQPEGTARLMKQLCQLGMGLALIHGKTIIDESVYKTLKKIARDLIPAIRLNLIKRLWDESCFEYLCSWEVTKEISKAINLTTSTAKLVLEDLMMVGVLNREIDGSGETSPYKWQIKQDICHWIEAAELFNDSETA